MLCRTRPGVAEPRMPTSRPRANGAAVDGPLVDEDDAPAALTREAGASCLAQTHQWACRHGVTLEKYAPS